MEFELKPVDSIPEYLDVYCGFNGDHEHLPIIWRYTNRSSYSGWADWEKKYGMVNFYYLYHSFIENQNVNNFIKEFLRIYYHEFIHLFFNFKSGKIYFKGKLRKLESNEKVIDLLAKILYRTEITHSENYWAYEIFEDELNEI